MGGECIFNIREKGSVIQTFLRGGVIYSITYDQTTTYIMRIIIYVVV